MFNPENVELQHNDAATLNFKHKTYILGEGFHLFGRKCNKFSIDEKSVDEKHALICITKSGHQIIDLESTNGTYVENIKIDQSYTLTNKISSIRFGGLDVKYTILNKSDSGFLDSKITNSDKDTSDIVASSPVKNRTAIRYTRCRKTNLTTSSTPNSKKKKYINSSSSDENEIEAEKYKRSSKSHYDNSFYVPETQQFVPEKIKESKVVNIFDTIIDKNIQRNINNMSIEDDYYVPETQEIFTKNSNSSSNEMIHITNEEFNASFNSNSNDSKSSEILCPLFNSSKSHFSFKQNVENNINDSDNITQLKWNESDIQSRSNATTPDIDFEINPEKTKEIENHNISEPKFAKSVTNISIKNNILDKLPHSTITLSEKTNSLFNSSQHEVHNDFMDDYHLLIPTQPFPPMPHLSPFVKPTNKNENNKILEKNSNSNMVKSMLNTDNDLDSTQIFIPPNIKTLKKDEMNKENNTALNLEIEELDATQVFIHPNSSKSNLQSFCEPEKKCVENLIEIPEKSTLGKQNIQTPNCMTTKENRIRNVRTFTNNEEEKNEPVSIKNITTKDFLIKNLNSSNSYFKSPISCNRKMFDVNADFMLDQCTPSNDIIKLPIKKQGYIKVIEKVNKPVNRIFVEETDDEDDEMNMLQNLLEKNTETNNITNNKKKKTNSQLNTEIHAKKSKTKKSSKNNIENLKQMKTSGNKDISGITVHKKETSNNKELIKTTILKKVSKNKNYKSSITAEENKTTMSSKPVRNSKNNISVTFTRVYEDNYVETVKNIGYTIVDNPEEASIIITNNEITRTWKLLIGLAKGIPIISKNWLDKIKENNAIVPYDNFYVQDKRAEKKFNFSLRNTLNLASTSSPLFENHNFIITDNTVPCKLEMKRIIASAGGTIVDTISEFSDEKLYVISDKKDSKIWPSLMNKIKNLKVIKTEAILQSVMQHSIRIDDNVFKLK